VVGVLLTGGLREIFRSPLFPSCDRRGRSRHVSGIAGDFHSATHNLDIKYFHPPPMTRKQKAAAFFSNFEALAIAALRGGAI
jgi:hypothetical protein